MEKVLDTSNDKNFKEKFSGNLYQAKTSLAIIWEALKNDSKFRLRGEVKDAEKFDDLLFYYKPATDDKFHIRHIQAKHCFSHGVRFKYDSFMDNRFGLPEYFIAFRKIRQISVDEELEDFVICSNVILPTPILTKKVSNQPELKLEFVKDSSIDALFKSNLTKDWERHKLLAPNEQLLKCFTNSTDLLLLADELVSRIIRNEGSNVVSLDIENHWLLRYHVALINENIIVKKDVVAFKNGFFDEQKIVKNPNDSAKNYQKFREKFIKLFQEKTTMDWNKLLSVNLHVDLEKVFDIPSCPITKGVVSDDEIDTLADNLLEHVLGGPLKINFDNPMHLDILKNVITKPEERNMLAENFLDDTTNDFRKNMIEIFENKLTKDFFQNQKLTVDADFAIPSSDTSDTILSNDEMNELAQELARHFVHMKVLSSTNPNMIKYGFHIKKCFKLTGLRKAFLKNDFFDDVNENFRNIFFEQYVLQKLKIIQFKLPKTFGSMQVYGLPSNPDALTKGINKLVEEIYEIYTAKELLGETDKILKYDKTKYGKNDSKGFMEALCGKASSAVSLYEFNSLYFNKLSNSDFKRSLETKFEKKFPFLEGYHIKITNYLRCYGKLAESSNITTDIKDFCKMFMLVTTPSEREITEVIAKELSMDLHMFSPDIATNIIDSFFQRIVKWATEHEDKFFERNELENVLERLKNQMKTLMLEGGQLLYCEHLKSFDLIFKELLIECKKFLDSIYSKDSVKQILDVPSNDPVLTAIKLEQTLRARTYDSFYKKILFYPLTSYLNWERAIRGNRIAPFKFKDISNLVVIVEDKTYENCRNFYERVCDSLKNFAHMKMIIITFTESALIENLKTCFDNAKGSSGPRIVKFDDIFDSAPPDDCTFTSLSTESQENLLKAEVQFFGKPVILNTLIDSETLYDFIDQLTFLKLIMKEDVIIGQTSDPDGNSGFYTPRNVGLIEIDSKLLTEKRNLNNNIIAIEGTNETFEEDVRQLLLENNVKTENIYTAHSLLHGKKEFGMIYVIFDPSTSEDQYNKLCEKYESFHWLKSVENRLLWCSSTNSPLEFFGSHARRNSYFIKGISALPYFLKNKTVVVADKAGMGKSTLLTHFAHEIQKTTIKKWIIKIDLNFYNKTLKEMHAKKGSFREEFNIRFEKQEESRWGKNDMQEYGKAILKALINEDEKDTRHVSLEENLFRSFFKNGDMIIMFDGFDEINSGYAEVVKWICLELKRKTKNQIWITTRTNLQNDLERDLKVFAFNLEPFSEIDQKNFLIQSWEKNWTATTDELHGKTKSWQLAPKSWQFCWHLKPGTWHLKAGTWHLKAGTGT